MSAIVVVKKAGHVAIGADTLTRYGSLKLTAEHVEHKSKILRVGDGYIGIVGSSAFRLVLQSYFAQLVEPPPLDSPQSIFEAARAMHKTLKQDYYVNPRDEDDDPFESSQVSCLIANPSGIFGLYSLRSVQEYARFHAFGSGDEYALGAMHAVYTTAPSAEAVARAGLEAAACFDAGTGPPLEIHTIELAEPKGRRPPSRGGSDG